MLIGLHILYITTLQLQCQSSVAVTENIWPVIPKTFTAWSFAEKV